MNALNWMQCSMRIAVMGALFLGAACGGDDQSGSGSASGSGGASSSSSASNSGSETSSGSASSSGSTSEAGTGSATGDGCDCMLGAFVPACGVDGMTYDATCGTQCVPVEIACMAECPCPTTMCGDIECAPGEVVCTAVDGGPAGSPTAYSCTPLPPACDGVADPDCACAGSVGCECTEMPEDVFQVGCAAP